MLQYPSSSKRSSSWSLNVGCLALAFAASCGGDATAERTWTLVEGDAWLSSVWGSAPHDVYATGLEGQILHSRDGGETWSSTTLPPREGRLLSPALKEVRGTDRLDVYVTGSDGTVAHSTDGGLTWSSSQTDVDTTLYGLWAFDRSLVYVVGDEGTILRSEDSGSTFTKQASPTSTTLWAVWGSSPDDLYAVGGRSQMSEDDPPSHGVILHSTDRGATWSQLELATEIDRSLSVVWGTGPDDVFVAGSGGLLLRSRDRGVSWTRVNTGLSLGFGALFQSDTGALYLGGGLTGSGTILRSDDGGESFSILKTNTVGVSSLWASEDGTLYAAGTGGLVVGRPVKR